MSGVSRRSTDEQSVFTRQSTILRKNLGEWDAILRNPRGEDWPKMLGRLNAALNQTANMDRSIEDVYQHFVYLPKQSTANAQDVPFFLSTRLEAPTTATEESSGSQKKQLTGSSQEQLTIQGDPVQVLARYENRAAELAAEYEDDLARF